MMLSLLLGLRLTGFLYMGAKVLNLIQGCNQYLCEVGLQVALNIGSVLFDMWAEPHLVGLVHDGEALETFVLGLLTSLTGVLALILVHLLYVIESWSKKLDIATHVGILILVLLLMFLVWNLTPSDLKLSSQHIKLPLPPSPPHTTALHDYVNEPHPRMNPTQPTQAPTA
ncbi:hypothetical protein Pmani_012730 [Petrolisthes manimaculis]|uniref:Uncharacterized protein n=1 Tax=Petrolisthes manimaculis TaxID=1843537 RepID=A0AAE1UCX6_9EUCA|nr:hypothetical protein Pmani_012730 [Petrolisthes manimaculis]